MNRRGLFALLAGAAVAPFAGGKAACAADGSKGPLTITKYVHVHDARVIYDLSDILRRNNEKLKAEIMADLQRRKYPLG